MTKSIKRRRVFDRIDSLVSRLMDITLGVVWVFSFWVGYGVYLLIGHTIRGVYRGVLDASVDADKRMRREYDRDD